MIFNGVEISLIFHPILRILCPLVLGWAPNHFVFGAQCAPDEKRLVCIPAHVVGTQKNHANEQQNRCLNKFTTDDPQERSSWRSGPEVIKLFSCSTQLSTKFILLMNVKMPTIVDIFTFISRIDTSSESLTV